MSCLRRFVSIAVIALAWSSLASAAPPTLSFQLEDLRRLVSLGDARISPDGRQIAMIVSTPDWKSDEKSEEIDLVDVATGAQRALTWKRTGLSSPTWSPDGGRLAFLADDLSFYSDLESGESEAGDGEGSKKAKDEKKAQVFVMSMGGGDPIRVTAAEHGVEAFSWSPDGGQIAYVAADEAANAKALEHHDDAFEVTDNHFLTRAALTPAHLWLVPATGGKPTTAHPGHLQPADRSAGRRAGPGVVARRQGRRLHAIPRPLLGPVVPLRDRHRGRGRRRACRAGFGGRRDPARLFAGQWSLGLSAAAGGRSEQRLRGLRAGAGRALATPPPRWLATSTPSPGCRAADHCCWKATTARPLRSGSSRSPARPASSTSATWSRVPI